MTKNNHRQALRAITVVAISIAILRLISNTPDPRKLPTPKYHNDYTQMMGYKEIK